MKHRDNNVTYGIQKEFDTYTKFVLEFIVSNILANISAENERRPEVIYMDDLFFEPFYEGIPTNVDKEYVKGRGEIYFIDNEYLAKASFSVIFIVSLIKHTKGLKQCLVFVCFSG